VDNFLISSPITAYFLSSCGYLAELPTFLPQGKKLYPQVFEVIHKVSRGYPQDIIAYHLLSPFSILQWYLQTIHPLSSGTQCDHVHALL